MKCRFAIAVSLLATSFSAACDSSESEETSGPGDYLTTTAVDSVVDGDTIRVTHAGENTRVRVLGIDSPESGGYQDEECWGAEASEFASEQLAEQTVDLFIDPSQGERDQFDRLLAYVLVDGENYSLTAARAGMAEAFIFSDNPLLIANDIETAVNQAQAEELGMWGPPCHYPN